MRPLLQPLTRRTEPTAAWHFFGSSSGTAAAAEDAIVRNPSWAKGHFRLGSALRRERWRQEKQEEERSYRRSQRDVRPVIRGRTMPTPPPPSSTICAGLNGASRGHWSCSGRREQGSAERNRYGRDAKAHSDVAAALARAVQQQQQRQPEKEEKEEEKAKSSLAEVGATKAAERVQEEKVSSQRKAGGEGKVKTKAAVSAAATERETRSDDFS